MAGPPAQARIPELDGLRGMAISFVIIWHYFYFFPAPSYRPAGLLASLYVHWEHIIAIGWSGVDLFFVLSGFLIGGILLDARKSPNYFKTFYLRRFYRILPIYYVWISLYVVLMLAAGQTIHAHALQAHLIDSPETPWPQILAHYLFTQNLGFVAYGGVAAAWFVSTWSLAVEEQFYLVAPPVIRFLPARLLPRVLTLVILGAPLLRLLVRSYAHVGTNLDMAYILMPCRADALAIGILSAKLWRDNAFRAWLSSHGGYLYAAFAIFFAGVAALEIFSPDQHSLAMQSVGFTWIAIFYGLTLLLVLEKRGSIIARVTRFRVLRELGRLSYCMYLIHQVVHGLCYFLLQRFPVFDSGAGVLAAPLIAPVLCYGIALLSWTYFENPLLRRAHKYKYSSAPPAPSASPI